jgi:hypothetical protein
MMENGIEVRITGDATGAIDATKVSSSAVAEAAALMKSKLGEIQASARMAFMGMGESAQAGAAKVAESATVVTAAGEKMGLAAQGAKRHWETLGGAMGKLNAVFLAITAAMAGGEVFKESVEASTKLTEGNLKLSRALGVTLEKASGVHVAMNKLGIETDTVTTASQKMVRQLTRHEDGFNKVGIATRDANGHFRDSLDILTDGLGKLGEYRTGVDRTALAQMMFGRGAGDLTQLMRLTNKEIEEGSRVAKELGLITTQDGVDSMRRYKDSVREVGEIFEAFKVQIGNAILPALTELAEWLRGHGASAIHSFISVMVELIDEGRRTVLSFRWMAAEVSLFATNFSRHVEELKMDAEIIKTVFETVKNVIVDALTLNWGAIEGDWNAGMAKVDQIATSHARHIAQEMGAAKAAVDGLANAWNNVGNHLNANQDGGTPTTLAGIMGRGRQSTPAPLRLDDPAGLTAKGGKEKHPREKKGKEDSFLSEWNTELEQSLAAEKNWGVDELAFTLKFWETKLALHKAKAKEQNELEGKIAKLKLATHKEALQEEIKDDRQSAAMAEESARTEVALAHEVLQSKLDIINREEQAGQISATAAARQRADLNRQIYQLDLDLEQRLYQIKLREMKMQQGLYREGTKEYKDYTRQIEMLEQKHQDTMTLLAKQAGRKRATDENAVVAASRQRWQGMANSFGSALSKMATLQQGFAATFKQIYQAMANTVAQVIEQMIAKWIMAKLIKLGLVKAEAASTIPALAATAGAGGVASMAAAPWPLDMTAPAFGASMAASALAFGAGASAMGGWDVPAGAGAGIDGRGGRSAIIHPREMVLPADLADQVRGGGAGGGHTFVFNGPTNKAELKKWFVDNHHAVGAGVRHFVRQGGNTSPNR